MFCLGNAKSTTKRTGGQLYKETSVIPSGRDRKNVVHTRCWYFCCIFSDRIYRGYRSHMLDKQVRERPGKSVSHIGLESRWLFGGVVARRIDDVPVLDRAWQLCTSSVYEHLLWRIASLVYGIYQVVISELSFTDCFNIAACLNRAPWSIFIIVHRMTM